MRIASTGPDRTYTAADVGGVVVTLDGTVVHAVAVGDRAVTIGRLPHNVIALPDQAVSRQHAEVRVEAGRAFITDVGSTGGTFVDGARILSGQPFALDAGSRVEIGPYVLTYTPPTPRPVAPPSVESAAAAPPTYGPPAHAPPATAPPDTSGDGRAAAARAAAAAALDEALPVIQARPTWRVPLAEGPASRYLAHLPALFQDNDFLGRMLLVFETLWEPLEQRQDHLPLYFDPRTCPAPLLARLAGWLELKLDPHWPEPRRRALVAEAMELYRWRGTPYGMTRMLEVCTGLSPTITEDPKRPYTFRISIPVSRGHGVRRETIEELIRAHKPAHVGYVLEMTT
jgi:phage tail-like protein